MKTAIARLGPHLTDRPKPTLAADHKVDLYCASMCWYAHQDAAAMKQPCLCGRLSDYVRMSVTCMCLTKTDSGTR